MSSRLRKITRRQQRTRMNVIRVLIGVALVVLALVAAVATAAVAFVANALKDLPDVNKAGAFKVAQPTKIYSADGVMLANFFIENREVVPMSAISTDLANAVVAVEDERFYEHGAIDPVGIIRAQVINLAAGGVEEGASTITQQYIRNTILSKEATQVTYTRKLREAWLANELEKVKTKREILELYLNTVYFGDGAYGAEAASIDYFGKHASELTLGEASLLAGIPQRPNGLNPYYNMAGAKTRQGLVLDRMLANGFITKAQRDEAAAQELVLKRTTDPDQGIYSCHYFVSYVRKQLLTQYPDDLVFAGGLKVYTTIDTKLQSYAEKAVRTTLNRRNDPDAALVSIDPRNGHIVAMYGGRDYKSAAYNTATQGHRQPGSSFKTFVLVTAIEKGIPPKRAINSSSPAYIPSKPVWRVSNSEGSGTGAMSITNATKHSVNVVFARLIWELGAREVARTAKRMGITSPIPAYPSIALGSAPVSPLDMASAYGTLAAGGILNKPTAITKIVGPQGEVIFEAEPSGTRVLSPEVSWATTQLLMGVVQGGTGRRASLPGRQVAGKTGTAQNYQDAWFVGYTPQLSTAVWMGYSEGSIPMRNVHGQRAFGGTFCAPIWRDFMAMALRGQPVLKFASAKSPHYVWKSSWSTATSSTVKPVAPKPTTTPSTTPDPGTPVTPVTPEPPVEPPPTPDPSGTPGP